MIIALDYDDTYTLHPAFWNQVVNFAHACGHTVVCVTAREQSRNPIRDLSIVPIVYAGMAAKRSAALRAGYDVDVWIDDMPEMIVQ